MRTKTLIMSVLVILSLAVVLAACSSGDGGGPAAVTSVVLPETGQTICYDASNNPTSCTGTGPDGDKLAGVAWPSPRFTNPDGTAPVTGSIVVDQLTGLMWLKDANCINTNYASFDADGTVGDGRVTWQHALDFVAGINAGTYSNCGGGRSDWRLPNRKELRSLIDYSRYNPALQSGYPFTGVRTGGYWSSTTYAADTFDAWSVSTVGGDAFGSNKTIDFCVWPVRTGTLAGSADVARTGQGSSYAAGDDGAMEKGVTWPSPRFTDSNNGTVTDNLTGLVWLKNANCFVWSNPWTYALTAANGLADGQCGLTDGSKAGEWRLPNVNELESIIHAGRDDTAVWLNTQGFSNAQASFYWTSTSYAGDSRRAWIVDIDSGSMRSDPKTDYVYHLAWPVRSGQ